MKLERQQLSEQLVLSQEALEQTVTQFKKQRGHLEDRVSELTQQNAAVHEEAEKVFTFNVFSQLYSLPVSVCSCRLGY